MDETKNIRKMTLVEWSATPFEETCADNVRKVEVEMLGCCGLSRGWNGRSCTSGPFLTRDEKEDWQEQCCSEFNVLRNSREFICNLVLSHRQVDLVSKFVTKAKQGDVGGTYMGQDARLLWAQPGLKKFEEELKKLKQKPQENQPVTSDFLEKHPNVYKEGLRKGWFRKEDPQEMSTSLVETGDSTCEAKLQKMKGNQEHCMDQTWTKVLNACFQAAKWQISDKPDPDEIDHQCQVNMTNPDVNKPKRVGTPDECLTVDFGNEEPFKWRFFTYDSDPPEGELTLDNPFLCFQEKVPWMRTSTGRS